MLDGEQDTPVSEFLQLKTGKVKRIPHLPGKTRHHCWYLNAGDYLMCAPAFDPYEKDDTTTSFLFPQFAKVANPGTKMGAHIKDVSPGATSKRFSKVVIADLQSNVTASGVRPGATNALVGSIPMEYAVAITGHDMGGFSSIASYIDCTIPLCMPGSLVLHGWKHPPWGHTSEAPSPPSLHAISGVSISALEDVIDLVLKIRTSSHPKIRQGGSLRKLIHGIFAALIMYHEDRVLSFEMNYSTVHLETIMAQSALMLDVSNVRAKLFDWGKRIRCKFDGDNARLVHVLDDSGVRQLGESMR